MSEGLQMANISSNQIRSVCCSFKESDHISSKPEQDRVQHGQLRECKIIW
jgi:hypothetical protein